MSAQTRTLSIVADAACAGHDTDVFFPAPSDRDGISRAKAVCAQCPVTEQCYQAGRTRDDGIFGGLTARERRARSRSEQRQRRAATR